MALSMAPILVHSEGIPAGARQALQRALNARPEQRKQHLEAAAQLIWQQTDLGCSEIFDLLGQAKSSF